MMPQSNHCSAIRQQVHSREHYSGVLLVGVPGVKPVIVELTDFKTKEKVDELEVDAVLVATGRAPYTQASPVTFHQTHHSQKLVPCHASHG